ncbi:MAG: hypothetical protein L3J24_08375 [Xanthomonadales bacterium]|nr:hypothetical protein [Xanthomonadales bacterium]
MDAHILSPVVRLSDRRIFSIPALHQCVLIGFLLSFAGLATALPSAGGTLRATLGDAFESPAESKLKTRLKEIIVPLPADLGVPISIAKGDFDGDGISDLIIGYADAEAGAIVLLRGLTQGVYEQNNAVVNGDGLFSSPEKVQSLDFFPDRLLAGDFNADGQLDLALMPIGSENLYFTHGTGTGSFNQSIEYPIGGQLKDIAVGEWQPRDGLPDLLLETQIENQATIYLLQGVTGAATAKLRQWSGFIDPVKLESGKRESLNSIASVGISSPQPSAPVLLADSDILDTTMVSAVKSAAPSAQWFPADYRVVSNSQWSQITAKHTAVDALYMRLTADAVDDLVVLQTAPYALAISFNVPVATITVNDTGDEDSRDGVVTFREAILLAEGTLALATLDAAEQAQVVDVPAFAQLDQISFDIPGAGPHTISPVERFPDIRSPIVIDGTTQPGFVSTPVIQLDGANDDLADGEGITALRILGGDSMIRGLVISNFVLGSIGGSAILLNGSGGSIIEGNYIGTDPGGTLSMGSGGNGVQLFNSSNNLIGGTVAAARNIISGQGFSALSIGGSGATGNRIEGNYFGTDFTGAVVIGNETTTIQIDNGASQNTIGGLAAGARNIISGNLAVSNPHIIISRGTSGNPNPTGNIFQGNYIGTDVTGMVGLGNASVGIFITGGATENLIGGTAIGAGNIISSSGLDGLRIGGSTVGNIVQGNKIGTDQTGSGDLGNAGHGVFLLQQVLSQGTQVGGTEAGAGNIIAYNGGDGVFYNTGIGASPIQGNSIFSNADLAIDLCVDYNAGTFSCDDVTSVNANDIGDVDVGANSLLNFPVLTVANSILGVGTQVTGTYNGEADLTLSLEFFTNSSCDSSGYGEAETPLGTAQITTDAAGDASFVIDLTANAPVGQLLVASATDTAGNTSELSACIAITGQLPDMIFGDGFEAVL